MEKAGPIGCIVSLATRHCPEWQRKEKDKRKEQKNYQIIIESDSDRDKGLLLPRKNTKSCSD